MARFWFVLVLVCLVGGCAGGAPQTGSVASGPSSKTIPNNMDEVWPAILEVLSERGWPVGQADKMGGRILTDFVDIGFDEINSWGTCPMGFDTQIMRGRMKAEITVTHKSVYETTVGVGVSIHGWDDGASKMWKNCESKGKVEEIIYNGLDAKLAAKK
jgi:hypothetical protein